MAMKTSTP